MAPDRSPKTLAEARARYIPQDPNTPRTRVRKLFGPLQFENGGEFAGGEFNGYVSDVYEIGGVIHYAIKYDAEPYTVEYPDGTFETITDEDSEDMDWHEMERWRNRMVWYQKSLQSVSTKKELDNQGR